jgi:hypothetical protein
VSRPKKILIVGAGAVGQAYGFHLSQGGAQVTYFVREKYLEGLAEGSPVHCLNGRHKGRHLFEDFEAICSLDQVDGGDWDQVWLCVSSPALYTGWLESFLSTIADATLVMLQPGMGDYAFVTRFLPSSQVVYGMITLASFHGPLADAEGEPAMTWWFPPLSAALFSGPRPRAMSVTSILKRGGMPAKIVRDIVPQLRMGSGILMPIIATLEAEGWHFSGLRRGEALLWAGRAAREATQASLPDQRRGLIRVLTQPWVLRLLVLLAPRVAPFNLEAMLKSHFVKVGDQTREMLKVYIDTCAERSLPADALKRTLKALNDLDDKRS